MSLRKIRDEQDARQCLAMVEAAGLSRRQWARDHGVDGRSLFAWARKFKRQAEGGCPVRPPEKHSGLVELVAGMPHADSRIAIRCRGFTVEVDKNFVSVRATPS